MQRQLHRPVSQARAVESEKLIVNRFFQFVVVALLIVFSAPAVLGQPDDETLMFEAALRALQGGFDERAEREFAEFIEKFPASSRLPEAILHQSRAAIRQDKLALAINLLTTNLPKAGAYADRYRYWIGEAHMRTGDAATAADTFAQVIRDFPESPRLLAASYGEALARFRLREWHRVVDLLQNPEGTFQRAAYERPTDELAIRGNLLLVEALIEQNDPSTAEKALARLTDRNLLPEFHWRREYLRCRLELARQRYDVALGSVTNLLTLATAANDPIFQAESVSLHANIFEDLGDLDSAVRVYSQNLSATTPLDRRRLSFLRIIQLLLAQNRLTDATQRLEQFFATYPGDAGSDVALLTLGELHLKQHLLARDKTQTSPFGVPPSGGSLVAATNFLQDALARFDRLAANFPQSPLVGRAQLDRGWCFWEQGRIAEAEKAFKTAVESLNSSEHLAIARFKLADAYFQQKQFTNALVNYRRALQEGESARGIQAELAPQALHQVARTCVEMGDIPGASDALGELLTKHADNLYGGRTALLLGHELIAAAKPLEARAVFAAFLAHSPDSPLRPQIELAVARSHAQEKQWDEAINRYSEWLTRYQSTDLTLTPTLTPPPDLRPQVEFDHAWAHYLAGRETNAVALFTNFVARFPSHSLAARAQFWVADFYSRKGDYSTAELLYQSTNLLNSPLKYEARLMAGKTAFARQAYKNAGDYFRALVTDENSPSEMKAEAYFALGDTILLEEGDNTSPVRKFDEAREAFWRIPQLYPTNRLVPLAWGQIGNCYFQLAAFDAKYYSNAIDSYTAVLSSSNRAPVAARSQAEMGIAQALERQAAPKLSPEKNDFLKNALDRYLNIFYGKNLRQGETADVFWVKEAGIAAGRLAEELKQWQVALNLYGSLAQLAPPLRPNLERKMVRIREQAATMAN